MPFEISIVQRANRRVEFQDYAYPPAILGNAGTRSANNSDRRLFPRSCWRPHREKDMPESVDQKKDIVPEKAKRAPELEEPMEDEEKIIAGRADVNYPALLTKDVPGG